MTVKQKVKKIQFNSIHLEILSDYKVLSAIQIPVRKHISPGFYKKVLSGIYLKIGKYSGYLFGH